MGDTTDLKDSVAAKAKQMAQMDGADEEADLRVTGSVDDALEALRRMIPADQPSFTELRGVHLGHGAAAGKTLEDVYASFLRWSQKPEDRLANRYNVSKAFRRLEQFVHFQERHYEKHFAEPVLAQEYEGSGLGRDMMMKIQIPNWELPNGCVLWVLDCKPLSTKEKMTEHGITDSMILRWFWYLMLSSIFDEVVQTEGVVLVESLDGVGLSDMLSLKAMCGSIEQECNEMFYSCMPFKMKECVLVGTPWWMSALLAVMRMLMSKKMAKRIQNLTLAQMQHHIGGTQFLPSGTLGGRQIFVDRYAEGSVRQPRDPCVETDRAALWQELGACGAAENEGEFVISSEIISGFRLVLAQSGVPVHKRSSGGKVQKRLLYVDTGKLCCAEKLGAASDKAWPLTEIQDVKRIDAPKGCEGAWLQVVHAKRTLEVSVEGEGNCNDFVSKLRAYLVSEIQGEVTGA